MSNFTFRGTICDHMTFDGLCDCNERRIVGEADFLTAFIINDTEISAPIEITEHNIQVSEINFTAEQTQADEHLEDERLMDEADLARLHDYENDVAEQDYLDACDACSYADEYDDDGHRSPNGYNYSTYYDFTYDGYNEYDGCDGYDN